MYTVRPFPKTRGGYKYILMAIDHYAKWSEAKGFLDHGAKTTAKFLENEIIYRYGIPRFISLTTMENGWLSLM
jgi:hypothetical protein